jgi:hypothetical protein
MVLPTDPLERVRTGMSVVDAGGERLGQVARVQLAPPPVTRPPASDIIDEMATFVPSPPEMSEAAAELDIIGASPVGHDPAGLPADLPDAVREHLAEVGFIEVDGPRLEGVARFVAADHIDEVRADAVVVRSRS